MSFTTIPQNLNRGISNARSYANDRVDVLLRPNTAQGIGGFLFDIIETDEIVLETDVTDHFTENNSFINDHVVNLPTRITIRGFQGELVFESPRGIAGAAQLLQNRLETVEAYLGDRTPGQIQQAQEVIGQAQTAISTINQTVDRVQNVVGLLGSPFGTEETRQQRAYNELVALRATRTPVTVNTPWAYFDSMIITALSFTQPENTSDYSEITVSLKEFRVSETQTVSFDEDLTPPRSQIQETAQEDQGLTRGMEEDIGPFLAGFQAFGIFTDG